MIIGLRILKQGLTPLTYQLLTRFGLAFLTVGLGTMGVNYHLIKTDLRQQVQQRSQSLGESLVFATEGLIEIKSSGTLQRVVQNYATLPAVLKIYILTPDGKIMAHGGLNNNQIALKGQIDTQIAALIKKSSRTGIPLNEQITLDEKPVLLNILPFSNTLFATPGRRGLAVLFVNLQEMEEEAWQTFSTSSLTLLSGIVLILGIMGLSIRRNILKPLAKINDAVAKSTSDGYFEFPTDLPNIETHFLAETFQQVLGQLTETEEQLAITEKMAQLSEALQESEERYRAIVKQTLDGIFLVDIETRQIIEANEAYCRLLGYSSLEVLQLSLYEVVGISQEEVDANINRLLQNRENFFIECQHRHKDGFLVSVDASISLIEFSGKEVCCFAVRDLTKRKEVQQSLTEKEILLKEIHHRVKNNLFVVSSLLEFQASYIDDPEVIKLLEDCQNRIRSMALVHQHLYGNSKLDKINFAQYIKSLIDNLADSHLSQERNIDFILDLDNIELNVETANPCGLIINELVSNALEHGFFERENGNIWLSLKQNLEHKKVLTIQDDGVGFGEDLDLYNSDSLGLELVCSLVEQLNANIELDKTNGTKIDIVFDELHYKSRI